MRGYRASWRAEILGSANRSGRMSVFSFTGRKPPNLQYKTVNCDKADQPDPTDAMSGGSRSFRYVPSTRSTWLFVSLMPVMRAPRRIP